MPLLHRPWVWLGSGPRSLPSVGRTECQPRPQSCALHVHGPVPRLGLRCCSAEALRAWGLTCSPRGILGAHDHFVGCSPGCCLWSRCRHCVWASARGLALATLLCVAPVLGPVTPGSMQQESREQRDRGSWTHSSPAQQARLLCVPAAPGDHLALKNGAEQSWGPSSLAQLHEAAPGCSLPC